MAEVRGSSFYKGHGCFTKAKPFSWLSIELALISESLKFFSYFTFAFDKIQNGVELRNFKVGDSSRYFTEKTAKNRSRLCSQGCSALTWFVEGGWSRFSLEIRSEISSKICRWRLVDLDSKIDMSWEERRETQLGSLCAIKVDWEAALWLVNVLPSRPLIGGKTKPSYVDVPRLLLIPLLPSAVKTKNRLTGKAKTAGFSGKWKKCLQRYSIRTIWTDSISRIF